MIWEHLTSPEIDKLDRNLPVVINLAAIEQHGPHLPLATDAMIGMHFLTEVERRVGDDVLILPQLKVCCSRHHLDYPGTLNINHMTLLEVLSGIAESVFSAGFKTLLLFNSHGGNQSIGQVAVESLGASYPDRKIALATWWSLAGAQLKELNESGEFGVGHACEFETSILLQIAPDMVRQPIPKGRHYVSTHELTDGDMLRPPAVGTYRSMRDISGGSGIVGSPIAASKEKGVKITEIVVEKLIELLRDFRSRSETN